VFDDRPKDESPRVYRGGGRRGRRSALLGGSALGASFSNNPQRLAIDGGTPVRSSTLGSGPYGPQFYDEVEEQELLDVLRSRSPFRRAGGKVVQFEREYAAHIGAKFAIGVTSGRRPCTRRWRRWRSDPATR
jgi:hypothetical protein